MNNRYSAQEKALILRKETLQIKDICILYDCGYRQARKRADLYLNWVLQNKGICNFNNTIITSEFIRYFNYDEERIQTYAKMGI